jgi:hypothetical protein
VIYGPDSIFLGNRQPPAYTNRGRKLSHARVLGELDAAVHQAKLCLPTTRPYYALGRGGLDVVAAIELDNRGLPAWPTLRPFIGVTNWNSGRRPFEIVLGGVLRLVISGYPSLAPSLSFVLPGLVFCHKHTAGLNTQAAIGRAITGALPLSGAVIEFASSLARKAVDDTEIAVTVVDASLQGILASSRIPDVLKLFRDRAAMRIDGSPSALDAMLAFATVNQRAPAMHQMEYARRFGAMLCELPAGKTACKTG